MLNHRARMKRLGKRELAVPGCPKYFKPRVDKKELLSRRRQKILFTRKIREESQEIIDHISRLTEPTLLLFETEWWRQVFWRVISDRIANPEKYRPHRICIWRDRKDILDAGERLKGSYQEFCIFYDADRMTVEYGTDR